MKTHQIFCTLTVLAAAALPGMSYGALFIESTSAASGTLNTPGLSPTANYRDALPSAGSSSTSTTDTPTEAARASGTSSAFADIGAVHAYSLATSSAYATGCCTSATGSSSAMAEWNDNFIAHSASFADGTHVLISASVLIHGSAGGLGLGQFWSSNVFWRSTEGINGQGWVSDYSSYASSGNAPITSGSGIFGLQTLVADIILGQNTNVFLRVETAASASTGGYGVSSADFSSNLGNTVSWQGITSVTANGVSVNDLTAVSSATGFNFVQGVPTSTVPLPAGIWLLGSGLLGMAGVIRKRKTA